MTRKRFAIVCVIQAIVTTIAVIAFQEFAYERPRVSDDSIVADSESFIVRELPQGWSVSFQEGTVSVAWGEARKKDVAMRILELLTEGE